MVYQACQSSSSKYEQVPWLQVPQPMRQLKALSSAETNCSEFTMVGDCQEFVFVCGVSFVDWIVVLQSLRVRRCSLCACRQAVPV